MPSASIPHIFAAVHRFFLPHFVSLGRHVVGIGKEWKPERVFIVKFELLGRRIRTDANDCGPTNVFTYTESNKHDC